MINMSNNETVKIAISGGMGKMGLLLSDFIENKDGYDISGIYDPEKESNTYYNYKSVDEINADILVEFSPANSINENLAVLAKKKINLVQKVWVLNIQVIYLNKIQKKEKKQKKVLIYILKKN